ncbi:MAG: hypothetical protein IPJ75_02680 [Ignavibacteriales bacterium]|nr:hypothetical protein [Ignavibacteriales bacterium]
MKKVFLLFFIVALFGAANAQNNLLGKSKSYILNNTAEYSLQELTTDEGVKFLFSEVPDIGQLFLFFDGYDICNTLALYPVNEAMLDALLEEIIKQGTKLTDKSWQIVTESGTQQVALEMEDNAEIYIEFGHVK